MLKNLIRLAAIYSRAVSASTATFLLACSATAHAAPYTWTLPINGSSVNYTWSSGTNWSGVPVSAADTTLTFSTGLAFLNDTDTLNNDIVTGNPNNAFQLNILNLDTTGTLNTTGNLRNATVNITGNPLNFVADGGNNPVVNLNSIQSTTGRGLRLTYAVQSNIVLDANTTFTGDGTATFNFSGVVSGGSGLTVTKSGTSTLVLSGANTYSGKFDVTAGTLQFAKMDSLYNNTPASWTAANINVQSGATLAVNVDSTGAAGFDVANLNTLLSNISVANTSTTGLQAGANIGIDTAGTFTQGNIIANSTGANGGAIGLTKLGAGTLILDKSNTYTGTTNVSSGTLQIGDGSTAGSISSTSSVITDANVAFSRSDDVTVSNVISGAGSVSKFSAGKLTLTGANTFTGTLSIGGGTVSVDSISASTNAQALGQGSLIQLGVNSVDGILEFTGSTNSTTDKQFRIGNSNSSGQFSNGTILNNGTGSLTFTNAFFIATTAGQNATRTITLGGTYSGGSNEIQGVIRNATASGSNPFNAVTVSGSNWKLSGANSYTGATSVTGGTLLINGSTHASSAVSVSGGATLGGTGRAGGSVSVATGGFLSPGESIESLATGALTMAANSTYTFGAVNNTSTGADLLAVNGTLSLSGVILSFDLATLAALEGGGWNNGDKLTLISYLGTALTAGFNGYADDATYTFGSNDWVFNYNDTTAGGNYASDAILDGQNNFITMTYTAIPEPSAASLLGALGVILCFRRRR